MTGDVPPRGRVLVVAGSDSGGGAGIQADIKTIMALGGYACTAITALTAQDTRGVHGVLDVPASFVRAQMDCVLADIGADAIKIGMLGRAEVVAEVAAALQDSHAPVVLDPVMVAKGGAKLMDGEARRVLLHRLVPGAALVTPNIPEAETLTGGLIWGVTDMERAARVLLDRGARAVLVKGGHLEGDPVIDLLVTGDGVQSFTAPRAATRHTHGTGCTLASGIAAGLALGHSLSDAVARAHAYVQRAILAAPGFGRGHGPLGHGPLGRGAAWENSDDAA